MADSQPQKNDNLLIWAFVGFIAFALWNGNAPESESALTAEIRQALDGDTEAAGKYASLYEGLPHVLGNEKLKTIGDVKRLMVKTREGLGQHHNEALHDVCEEELGFLKDGKAPFTAEVRSRTESECKRLAAAFRAASRDKAPTSIADTLRQFADKMEARK